MKRILFIFAVILFTQTSFLYAKSVKNILILNSYHKGFEWSDKLIDGMEKLFYKSNIDTTILYMDSKRISSKDYFDKLKELYQLQLTKHKYDLVVAIDKFAYAFILQNYKELNIKQPIYFLGIEQFFEEEVKEYGLEGKVSGMMERRAIEENIDIIKTLMPTIKKLYILNDQSANGDDSEIFIKNAIKKVSEKIEIEYIRKIRFEDLIENFQYIKKMKHYFL